MILCVVPPTACERSFSNSGIYEHLGIGYIAAMLQCSGHQALILDCTYSSMDYDSAAQRILDLDPRVIGITAPYGLNVVSSAVLARTLRRRGFAGHICIGGPAAALNHSRIMEHVPEIDSVCLGEGEYAFLDLVRAALSGQQPSGIPGILTRLDNRPRYRPVVETLDHLPHPIRVPQNTDGLPIPVHASRTGTPCPAWSISASRGCMYRCSFCSVHTFYHHSPGPRWRGRSPHNIVSEITALRDRWPLEYIFFTDDNFLGEKDGRRERMTELSKLLRDSGPPIPFSFDCRPDDVVQDLEVFALLKDAGLNLVSLGIETGIKSFSMLLTKQFEVEVVEEAVSLLGSMGIEVKPNYMLMYPYITLDELEENRQFVQRTGLHRQSYGYHMFTSKLGVITGTPLENRLRNAGLALYPAASSSGTDEEKELLRNLVPLWEYEIQDEDARVFFETYRPFCNHIIKRASIAFQLMGSRGEKVKPLSLWLANLGLLCYKVYCSILDELRSSSSTSIPWQDSVQTYDEYFLGQSFEMFTHELLEVRNEAQTMP